MISLFESHAENPAFRCWMIVAMLLSIAFATPVRADDTATDKQRATELFQRGLRHFDRGNYADACPLFEQSLALYPGIGTRGRLAECYDGLGRVASAYRLYLQVETLSLRDGDKKRAAIAARRAARLKPRLSSLVITPDVSFEAPGFTVTNDGRTVEPRTFGTKLLVDPGTHRIKAVASGYQSWTTVVQVAEGESRPVAIPTLQPVGQVSDVRSPSGGGSGVRVTGYVLLGAGTAGLLASLYFGQNARSSWDAISPQCKGPEERCSPADYTNETAANDSAEIANYAAIAGGALFVTGAVLWLVGRSGGESRADAAVSVTPTVTPDLIGVTLRGSL